MSENVTTKCTIGEVRLSYLHVFTPEAIADGADKKYSVSIIIPKSDKDLIARIKEAIRAAEQTGVSTKWGGKKPSGLKYPVRDGDEERPGDEAYADSYFINASSKTKPGVVKVMTVNGEKKLVEITNEDDIYSGCYGYVSVNFYPYAQAGNKGIACGLNNVLKTRDGEYLGGRSSAANDFGEILGGLGDSGEKDNDFDDVF